MTLIKEIISSDISSDYFGVSFDVYGDYLVAGAPYEDEAGSNTGSLYIFKRNEGGADNWGQIKKLVAESGSERLEGAVPIVCNPGDAVICNRQLLHGSFPNCDTCILLM